MCHSNLADIATIVIAIIALLVSVVGINSQRVFSRKTILISIQRDLIFMASDFAAQINDIWDTSRMHNKGQAGAITKVLIAIEALDKSFSIYNSTNTKVIKFKDDIEFMFWKQINGDTRNWIKGGYKNDEQVKKHPHYLRNLQMLEERFRPIFEGRK